MKDSPFAAVLSFFPQKPSATLVICQNSNLVGILMPVSRQKEMEGKVAIVTGASSGIGRASAIEFSRNGTNVVAVGRNESDLNSLRDESRDLPGAIRTHLADITELSQI